MRRQISRTKGDTSSPLRLESRTADGKIAPIRKRAKFIEFANSSAIRTIRSSAWYYSSVWPVPTANQQQDKISSSKLQFESESFPWSTVSSFSPSFGSWLWYSSSTGHICSSRMSSDWDCVWDEESKRTRQTGRHNAKEKRIDSHSNRDVSSVNLSA